MSSNYQTGFGTVISVNYFLKLLTHSRAGMPLRDLDMQAGKHLKKINKAKFNKAKFKVLHLGENNSRLGIDC